MARTVRDTNLGTRSARQALAQRRKPYWRAIDQGCHIGFYKGARGGAWTARYFVGEGRYVEHKIGMADDVRDANGVDVLSFSQAQAEARKWFDAQARVAQGLEEPETDGPYTVAQAVADYLAWFEAHRKGIAVTRSIANTHIVPALGTVPIRQLTTARIRAWHEGIATAKARLRSSPDAETPNTRPTNGEDGKRKRRASANRALTVFRAVLNRAFVTGKVASDEAWRRVKPFRNADAPVVRYLTPDECVRLVNAADPSFRPLIQAALFSGLRWGEICALRCGDLNPDTGLLTVRTSKSGKPRHAVLADEGRQFFLTVTAGRAPEAFTFTRTIHRRDGSGTRTETASWSGSDQTRYMAIACKRARIDPPTTFHVLRHTHASLLVQRGLSLLVVAEQLGHSTTRMAQRYAHLAPGAVAEAIRGAFPRLGIAGEPGGNVEPIRRVV